MHAVLTYLKIIPSLKTFLENHQIPQSYDECHHKVLPVDFKGTIRQTMLRYYMSAEGQHFQVQSSENDLHEEMTQKDMGSSSKEFVLVGAWMIWDLAETTESDLPTVRDLDWCII